MASSNLLYPTRRGFDVGATVEIALRSAEPNAPSEDMLYDFKLLLLSGGGVVVLASVHDRLGVHP